MGKYCGNCGLIDKMVPAHNEDYGTCAKTGIQVYLANPGGECWEPEEAQDG